MMKSIRVYVLCFLIGTRLPGLLPLELILQYIGLRHLCFTFFAWKSLLQTSELVLGGSLGCRTLLLFPTWQEMTSRNIQKRKRRKIQVVIKAKEESDQNDP